MSGIKGNSCPITKVSLENEKRKGASFPMRGDNLLLQNFAKWNRVASNGLNQSNKGSKSMNYNHKKRYNPTLLPFVSTLDLSEFIFFASFIFIFVLTMRFTVLLTLLAISTGIQSVSFMTCCSYYLYWFYIPCSCCQALHYLCHWRNCQALSGYSCHWYSPRQLQRC